MAALEVIGQQGYAFSDGFGKTLLYLTIAFWFYMF
ncbi:hypothetical protein SAMN05421780_105100 [Flexibacter flexilis DSM 6793]|uniref:Uncharacterized protein n=1 Tax=Flexibacter flexilis DSM 6793 TaxID=927664 RepID=A0A1I1IUN4_9BACT|nr:hypothetical protein SAMN05421780_105100 [Flexibacter flexilis DSM 6793]